MFEETLRAVPDYRVFHTVDELNASSEQLASEFSGSVKLIKIGRSREKDDILALRIGKGKKKAVLFALPHPNEPIGAMTLEYFSRRLAEEAELEKLDFTWKNLDPIRDEAIRREKLLIEARTSGEHKDLPKCPSWMCKYCEHSEACLG